MTATILTSACASPAGFGADEAVDLMSIKYGIIGNALAMDGEKDANFRFEGEDGRVLFLKVAGAGEDEEFFSMHTAAIRHVTAVAPDLPVHRLVETIDRQPDFHVADRRGNRRIGRVVQFMPGKLMSSVASTRAARINAGAALADLQTALVGFSHAADYRELVWDLSHAGRLRSVLAENPTIANAGLMGEVLDRFESKVGPELVKTERIVVHNDLSRDNLLVHPSSSAITGIIDFGDMVRTHSVADVAIGAAYQMSRDDDPLGGALDFLRGFVSRRNLADAQIELFFELLMVRTVMRILVPVWRASQVPGNASYVLRNLDLSNFLLTTLARIGSDAARDRVWASIKTEPY